jgi:hypothetical protein
MRPRPATAIEILTSCLEGGIAVLECILDDEMDSNRRDEDLEVSKGGEGAQLNVGNSVVLILFVESWKFHPHFV